MEASRPSRANSSKDGNPLPSAEFHDDCPKTVRGTIICDPSFCSRLLGRENMGIVRFGGRSRSAELPNARGVVKTGKRWQDRFRR